MNFSKTTKLHEPVGLVQFVVFEKFISAYLHQIALEIILLLVYNLHEKRITDSQDRRHLAARAPFVICTHVATSHSFSANHTRVLFPCISITAQLQFKVWLANTYMHEKSAIRTELNVPSHNEKKK